jgi:hypothetical protein
MPIRFTLLWLAALVGGMPGLAQAVPLPPPRPVLPWDGPREFAAPMPPPRPAIVPEVRRAQGEFTLVAAPVGGACADLLAQEVVIAETGQIVDASEGCGTAPVARLSAILLGNGKSVALRPAAVLRCETALAVARWIREDIAAAAVGLGSTLARVEVAASYACRSRNNVTGAVLSEHGRANALDMSAFTLADGRILTLADPKTPASFLAEVRRSACARFTTVLGPGADRAHEFHLHVDLAERRGGYRMCQWPERKPASD